jgi:DNA-binding response OmpR family regulator
VGATPRLLICEDAPGFQLLVATVFSDAGFEIAGSAATWDEAETLARDLPDVVLLDLWLPEFDKDGIARVRAAAPDALLAIVSSLSPEQSTEYLEGVDGIDMFLSKRAAPDELVAAVKQRLDA